MNKSLYDFSVKRIDGTETKLDEFKGDVLLIVNVASKCGLTRQYEPLEKMYEDYHKEGFQVLGFPANNFAGQEPGSNEEIEEFCRSTFGVKFPMFSKISVKGHDQHPLYNYLIHTKPEPKVKEGSKFEDKLKGHGLDREKENDILWNFEKFLVNRNGEVLARFAPDISPDDPMIKTAVEDALADKTTIH